MIVLASAGMIFHPNCYDAVGYILMSLILVCGIAMTYYIHKHSTTEEATNEKHP